MIDRKQKAVNEFLNQVGNNKVPNWAEFYKSLFDEYERLMIAIFYPEQRKWVMEVYEACVKAYIKRIETDWETGRENMADALDKLDEFKTGYPI